MKVKLPGSKRAQLPLYSGADDIAGFVKVNVEGKAVEHLGVKIELIGHLEIYSENKLSTDFICISRQLEPAGFIDPPGKKLAFKYPSFDKPYQTFVGIAGLVKYFIRATLVRNYNLNICKQVPFAVQVPSPTFEKQVGAHPMKMEVGIEGSLHIVFEWNKSYFHLKDTLIGVVTFHLVKFNIQSMVVNVTRKEIFGTGQVTKTEQHVLTEYEVMDGCPVKGETVPVRLNFSGLKLTPSYANINNRLAVRHFLSIVLYDDTNKRFFKNCEIVFYRFK